MSRIHMPFQLLLSLRSDRIEPAVRITMLNLTLAAIEYNE